MAAHQAGETSSALARRYRMGKATVLRLLDEHQVTRRRQSLSLDDVTLTIRLYGQG